MHVDSTRRHGSDAEIAFPPQGNTHGAYTTKQGQYLAFIYYYTKIHRRSPSEADIRDFFQVSPPAVHQMIMNLAKLGLIEKTPGQGRSIKLLLTREQLPDLL
jgi:DNA-binding MarR family transcriptional regulator